MSNQDPVLSQSKTEEQTFNRLRRIPYRHACAEFTIMALELNMDFETPNDEMARVMDPLLKRHGWTLAELNAINDDDSEFGPL